MKNMEDLRAMALELIMKVSKNQDVSRQVNDFCKLANVITDSLKVEITHNHANRIMKPISFIEGHATKLIELEKISD